MLSYSTIQQQDQNTYNPQAEMKVLVIDGMAVPNKYTRTRHCGPVRQELELTVLYFKTVLSIKSKMCKIAIDPIVLGMVLQPETVKRIIYQ